MKVISKSKTTKKKNFPKILLGSQKIRNKIKAKNRAKKRRIELKRNRLACERCDERFPTWWEMRDHWISTGHKEPEECRWCRKKTFTLQSHLCKEHWSLASMCKFCGQLFMFREGLQEHEQRHSRVEYRCYSCGKRQKDEDLLRKHVFKHYVYERYGCNVCEKRFKKKKNVEKHLKYIHFICQYCGSSCENKDKLIEHWKTHDDLKCTLCLKVFSQKNRLKYHYQMRHGHQDFYKCSLCFLRFPLKSRLLEHLKLKHKGYAKISCETCEMPFLYWSQYLKHFEVVHVKPQDKYACSFCDYSSYSKIKLQWHVEKTSGDGFFCKVCQIRSVCKTKFDEHMKLHEGKKVYSCDHCDKSYATVDTLKHHMSVNHQDVIIESNRKGHHCLVSGCRRYYVSKSSLARHMRRNHTEAGDLCISGQYCADNTVMCRLPLTMEKNTSRMCHNEAVVSSSTQPCPDEPYDPFDESTWKSGFEEEIVMDTVSNVSLLRQNQEGKNIETDIVPVDVYYCDICCKFWFAGDKQFRKHMTTHHRQVWDDECGECEEILESPEDAVRHYVEDHLKVEYRRY